MQLEAIGLMALCGLIKVRDVHELLLRNEDDDDDVFGIYDMFAYSADRHQGRVPGIQYDINREL